MGGWNLFREKIPARQLGSWCFAAVVPVLVRWMSGYPWPAVMAVAVASGVAVWTVWRQDGDRSDKLWVLRAMFATLAAGVLARASAGSWPGDNAPGVPLILLALAAWSAGKGPSAAARVGCVLFWFVLGLYLLVLGTAVREVHWRWLMPSKGDIPWMGVAVALLPGAAVYLLKAKGSSPRAVVPVGIGVVASLITGGVLSPWVAAGATDAFYEMTRSLEVLGVARRFEAVLSAGMTVGWFCCLTLLLSVAAEAVERHKEGWGRGTIYAAAAVAGGWVLLDMRVPEQVFTAFAFLLWTIVPLTNNRKKDRKSA